jgi:uncharacterized protein YjiS (DUF1127 family)
MTISQSSSSDSSSRGEARRYAPSAIAAASFVRFAGLALARWRERRRAKADLARLAEAGDYLLLDVGLDPELARRNPAALLDQVARDRWTVRD